jgi:hypothetical protein
MPRGVKTVKGAGGSDNLDPSGSSPRDQKFAKALSILYITDPDIACAIIGAINSNSLTWLELEPGQSLGGEGERATGTYSASDKTNGVVLEGRRPNQIATAILHEFEHSRDGRGLNYGYEPDGITKTKPPGGMGGPCAHAAIYAKTFDRLCKLADICAVPCVDLREEWSKLAKFNSECMGINGDPGQIEECEVSCGNWETEDW